MYFQVYFRISIYKTKPKNHKALLDATDPILIHPGKSPDNSFY
jgi:hypothetical protein